MKFIHYADVHLDTPLQGLAEYPGAPVDEIRNATRRSFERVLDTQFLRKWIPSLLLAIFTTKGLRASNRIVFQ